ncbi:MAG: hypothetical protein F9K43_19560 [Bauldia sp.]|nr:MAG: hypothetical protein F9K43_19560 [Bauldia sp.]
MENPMYLKRLIFAQADVILSIAMAFSGPVHAKTLPAPFDKAAISTAVANIAAELRAAYVFPDKGNRAAEAIERAFSAKAYDGVADPGQFAKRITADLQSVTSDDHIRVFYGFPSPSRAAPSPPNDAGFERVDRLKGNVGYIRLARFVPPEIFEDAADNAMRLVADTDALISLGFYQFHGGDRALAGRTFEALASVTDDPLDRDLAARYQQEIERRGRGTPGPDDSTPALVLDEDDAAIGRFLSTMSVADVAALPIR